MVNNFTGTPVFEITSDEQRVDSRDEEFSIAHEVETIASKLIPKHHKHLRTARLKYLFTSKVMKKHGQVVLGKAKGAASLVRFFGRCDFVVIISLVEWSKMDHKAREALVDHELCHCFFKVSEKGVHSWTMRGHEIEEFREILERHGLWSTGTAMFAETVQQLNLFDMPAEPKRGRKKK